jgi:hypothetical protein
MGIPLRLAAAVAALALLTAETTQTAFAQETPAPTDRTAAMASPVNIERFGVTSAVGKASRPFVVLWFRNTSALVADEVRFIARSNGGETTIVEKGVFSPGVLVQHQVFAALGALGYRELPAGSVQYVHFTNGTHWEAP